MSKEERDRIHQLEQRVESLEKILFNQGSGRVTRLTVPQAAEYIGMSVNGLRRLTCKKLIPFYKPSGKQIYFLQTELDEWMIQNRNVPSEARK